jgi:hypothetical protein
MNVPSGGIALKSSKPEPPNARRCFVVVVQRIGDRSPIPHRDRPSIWFPCKDVALLRARGVAAGCRDGAVQHAYFDLLTYVVPACLQPDWRDRGQSGRGDGYPSDSSGIEPEHMEQVVDPSRCATNVPLGYYSGGGSGRSRGRTEAADLRIHRWAPSGSYRRPADSRTRCAKMCHLALLRDGSGGHESRS